MRTEQEMLERILHFAQEREDIKAVYMNGSRANPKAPKDILQDFDIVYVVESTAPYIQDKSWIPFFGEIAVMQEPDDKDFWDNNSSPEKQYAYLLQFMDGNRIDLTFQSLQTARETYGKDSLTKILLDKDQLLPSLPPPDDSSYRIKKTYRKGICQVLQRILVGILLCGERNLEKGTYVCTGNDESVYPPTTISNALLVRGYFYRLSANSG